MGTLLFIACLIDSTVCGITPSSAATTRTTISVSLAPLPLIAEKAACPGVSKKVIDLPERIALSRIFYEVKLMVSYLG